MENKPKEKQNRGTNYENRQNKSKSFPIACPYCYRARACRGIRGLRYDGAPVELQWQFYIRRSHPGDEHRSMAVSDHDCWRRASIKYNADGTALVWIDTRSEQWGYLRL